MGRSWIVPGSPARRGTDLSAEAPGWERVKDFLGRLR
jgi:hypothetical protein